MRSARPSVCVLLCGAGHARRMAGTDKIHAALQEKPVYMWSVDLFASLPEVREIVLAVREEDAARVRAEMQQRYVWVAAENDTRRAEGQQPHIQVIAGGETRQTTVQRAFQARRIDAELIAVHDAARPLVTEALIRAVCAGAAIHGACIPGVTPTETLHKTAEGFVSASPTRSAFVCAQTPQVFRTQVFEHMLRFAEEQQVEATDECGLYTAMGGRCAVVPGDAGNRKITEPRDLAQMRGAYGGMGDAQGNALHAGEVQSGCTNGAQPGCTNEMQSGFEEADGARSEDGSVGGVQPGCGSTDGARSEEGSVGATRTECGDTTGMRIGHGYDVHRLVTGRRLVLGGVDIPYTLGLDGHSDADVLAHAAADAVLGAAGSGDIGRHFPDTEEAYRGISSMTLLEHVAHIARDAGLAVGNLDATVVCQAPKLAHYLAQMEKNIAAALGIPANRVNVKATTEEGLGFTGTGAGIAAHAVCLLVPR